MTPHLPHLAPRRPVIHLSTPSGWLNDPNGLCVDRGTWHACYQHDPATNVHGTMHWGHATSVDLLRWEHHPIALAPDELGVVYSGSAVVDHDDTAGFGAGAMIAVFTHHLDGLERQSLAVSTDAGRSWTKYGGNPVLESAGERDFRDPKVIRHTGDDGSCWVMCLAVGDRIAFYRSGDLRDWEHSGDYAVELAGLGPWECPDLVRLAPDVWLLVFCAVGAGPHGHGGTLGVLGDFDGRRFEATGAPFRLDDGPDFYAAQTFSDAPGSAPVALAWMNSWHYARTHPSSGWRGVFTLPRRLELVETDHGRVVTSLPAVDLRTVGSELESTVWRSDPQRALHVEADGDIRLDVIGDDGRPDTTVTIADGRVRLRRRRAVTDRFAETYGAPLRLDGPHRIVVDHGTIEVFAGGGGTAITALVFPGPDWSVRVDGAARLRTI